MWNGSSTNLTTFKNTTGVTYPLLRNASSLVTAYACDREYYFVIDTSGFIRYRSEGALYNRYFPDEINAVIDSLLAQSAVEPGDRGGETPTATRSLALGAPQPAVARALVRCTVSAEPSQGELSATVYDIRGRRVRTLLEPGRHATPPATITWDLRGADGRRVAAGLYVLRLSQGSAAVVRRVVVTE